MTLPAVRHATFTIDRHFPFPPATVFRGWSDPAAYFRWFVSGEGWDIAEHTHDFRVLGRETSRFRRTGDTLVIYNETLYHDIVPDRRIVFAYSMGTDTGPFSTSLGTIELTPSGTGTHLRYTEQIAQLDGMDQVPNREAGCRELFDKLAAELHNHHH